MADYYKCSDCGWGGTAEEAMEPDKEIEEDWKNIWRFRKALEPELFMLIRVLGETPSVNFWMPLILVCPKCANEVTQVTNEETGPEEQ
ncbi:MAG TPA: hypothetical protein VM123_20255 [archaeon]|nr:hypothetical protein [archaeon]